MAERTMGELISAQRREKGMTQRELADRLGITDKAVSKWERSASYPDTATLPKLAELLGISVAELLDAKAVPATGHRGAAYFMTVVWKAVALAMGVAVVVLSLLGDADTATLLRLLGIGLAALAIDALRSQR